MGEYVLALVDELLLGGRILKRSQVVAALDLLLIAVGPEAGQNIGHEGDQQDDDQADHGDLVFAQTAHAVLPEVDALAHDHKALLFLIAGRQKVVSVQLQAERILFDVFHNAFLLFYCSLMRGSMILYRISTITLATMTMLDSRMVVPMIMV